MTGGMGGGYGQIAETTGMGWKWVLSFAAIMLCMVGGFAWFVISEHNELADKIDRANAGALFHPGDMVRSKVGGFRGIITDSGCYYACEYKVRFPVASMEPRWVSETEIELALSPAQRTSNHPEGGK